MPLVAGVDSSTSACKVTVHDADTGELVSSGRAPHPPTTPPCSEQDPSAWWAAFQHAWSAAGADGMHRPAAISVAGQQHGLVVLDADRRVLRPAKLWNDTESAVDADALVEVLGAEGWAAACGSVPVPSFTISKLAWLRRCEPEVFRRIAHVMLPHDWLTFQLTGRLSTDRGDASGTGWWSPAEGQYRTDLLDLVDDTMGWSGMLPEVLGPAEPAGEWDGLVVGPGTGDNMAAALGMALGAGDLALSLGTSGVASCVSDRPTSDPTGTVAGFADATGRFLPLVCTLNATKVTDAVARLLGVDAAGLDTLALQAPVGSGGLVLVPHLDGERTPNRPDATGTLSGIRSEVTRPELARAAVEGVVCNLLAGADELSRWVLDVGRDRTVLVGGGAHSPAYRQVVADVAGRPVLIPASGELVARGAAMQAAAVLAGVTIDAVRQTWGPGPATVVDPTPGVDGAALRQAFAEHVGSD
jgi:xylulokinase